MYIELENSVDFALNVFSELDENETEKFFAGIGQKYEEAACRQWATLMLDGEPENAPETDTEPEQDSDTPDLAPETAPEISVLQSAPVPEPEPTQPEPTAAVKPQPKPTTVKLNNVPNGAAKPKQR